MPWGFHKTGLQWKSDAELWKTFPECSLPQKASSREYVDGIRREDSGCKRQTYRVWIQTRNWNVWRILKNGADVHQKTRLPPCMVDNAPPPLWNTWKLMQTRLNNTRASQLLLPFLFLPEKIKNFASNFQSRWYGITCYYARKNKCINKNRFIIPFL